MENLGHRVAIVGAGYAGMAAAVTLAQRGIPVTVFESGPVPGGRARRVTSQGQELDNGQHILIGGYATLLGLMRLVGAPEDALVRVPLALRYPGKFSLRALPLPAPLDLLGGLLLCSGVSLGERLGAIRFMARMRAAGFRIDADCDVEQLLKKHGQDGRIGHFMWRPLCVSALNTPTTMASAQTFLAVLRDALFGKVSGPFRSSDLLLPRVDLSRLFPEPAADFVRAHGGEIRFGETVRDLSDLKSFASVIVAVGPHQLKVLFPQIPEFEYQPIYTCYLQYSASLRLPFPMLGLSDGLVQWVFDRGALLGEKGRLACVISAQGDHQQLSQEELSEACIGEIARELHIEERPQWCRVIAEKRATIASLPGRKPAPQTGDKNLYLAGDYLDPDYPPTLEAAASSGVRAAQAAAHG